MDYVLHYTPTIEKIARKFYVSSEHKEDLVQEGLLKLYKLHNICNSKNEDFYSKDWQKIIMRSVKNCMIDHIRKLTRRSKELFSEDFLFPDDSVQFELTQIRHSMLEIKRILNDSELKIFEEICDPSPELKQYIRESNVILRNWDMLPTRSNSKPIDLVYSGYFGVTQRQFNSLLSKIKQLFYKQLAR